MPGAAGDRVKEVQAHLLWRRWQFSGGHRGVAGRCPPGPGCRSPRCSVDSHLDSSKEEVYGSPIRSGSSEGPPDFTLLPRRNLRRNRCRCHSRRYRPAAPAQVPQQLLQRRRRRWKVVPAVRNTLVVFIVIQFIYVCHATVYICIYYMHRSTLVTSRPAEDRYNYLWFYF